MPEPLLREKLQHLWCQHCKALQKSNDTVVECWYNPLDERPAFCAANMDATASFLAVIVEAVEGMPPLSDEAIMAVDSPGREIGFLEHLYDEMDDEGKAILLGYQHRLLEEQKTAIVRLLKG